jgi:hypothetical protein
VLFRSEFIAFLEDENCKKFDHFSVWCKEEARLLDENFNFDKKWQ